MSEAFKLIAPVQFSSAAPAPTSAKRGRVAPLRIAAEVMVQPAADPQRVRFVWPTAQERWEGTFAPADTRLIIRGLKSLAEQVAGPVREERAEERENEIEARKGISRAQKERVSLLTQAIDLEEISPTKHAARIISLRALAADRDRTIRQLATARDEARRKQILLLQDKPFGTVLFDGLKADLMAWEQMEAPWPRIADLVAWAHQAHQTIIEIIADHAITWAWREDIPRRWLSHAGYVAAGEIDVECHEDGPQWVRTLQVVAVDPPIPAGTLLPALTIETMSLQERVAVEATRRGRQKANEKLWATWLETMRDSLSPQDLAGYEKRQKVWAKSGWAGRRAAGVWLTGLVTRTGLEKPRLLPDFVAVRWPEDRGPDEQSLRYVALGRGQDARPVDEDELLDALDGDPAPEPRPAPPLRLLKHNVIVVDTETTGLASDPLSEVIEIGAVVIDPWGNIVDRFSELARPRHGVQRAAARNALRLTGIKSAELRMARPVDAVAADFAAWVKRWDLALTAYNVGFDKTMLGKHGVTLTWGRCAMHLVKHVHAGSRKLNDVSDAWGLRCGEQTHRALDDAQLAAAVLCETLRRLIHKAATDDKAAKTLAAVHTSFTPPSMRAA